MNLSAFFMSATADQLRIFGGPNTQVRGTGAPQVRRAPTKAMKMPKAWPLLVSP